MCKQLIDQQTLLLTILHQRLDTLPYIQEQMLQLQQYHNYLQVNAFQLIIITIK